MTLRSLKLIPSKHSHDKSLCHKTALKRNISLGEAGDERFAVQRSFQPARPIFKIPRPEVTLSGAISPRKIPSISGD